MKRLVPGAWSSSPLWIILLVGYAPSIWAQSTAVTFLGMPTAAFTSNISFPIGLATDTRGNVYIAEFAGNAVYKETLQADGSYVQSTVASGFSQGPVGLAIDSAGNVYIGLDDASNGLLKETLQSNGTYVQSIIGNGPGYIYGLAIDPSGIVYATTYGAATGGAGIYKFTPSGNTYISTIIYTSGSPSLAGLALDTSGNLFVVSEYSNTLYKLTPSGNPALLTTHYTPSTITTGATMAFGVAVDTSGDLYIADVAGSLRLETPDGSGGYIDTVLASGLSQSYGVTLSPAGVIYFDDSSAVVDFSPTAVYLGSQTVNTASGAATLNYAVQAGTVVGAIHVVTQGVINTQSGAPEFVNASGGTCTPQTYSGMTVCSVNVTLTPQFAGLRTGAVEFLDDSGNLLNTAYLYGIGIAPVAAFSPGTTSLLSVSGLGGTPLAGPTGPGLDAAGNLFLADSRNNRIVKVAPGGAASVLNTPGITLSAPTGVAIDGAGNLFIADSGNQRVVELSAQGIATVMDTNSITLSTHLSIAADGLGNVYAADAGNQQVLVFPQVGSAFILPITGVTLASPLGIAADGNGNVFIADTANSRIVEVNGGTGTVMATGALSPALLNPEAVAVDAVGDVYVADTGNNRIVEISAGATNGIELSKGSYALSLPDGVAVDSQDRLYIGDANNITTVNQLAPAAVSLNAPGATAAVTLLNLGDDVLTFPVPASGQNPSFGTTNFSLANAGTTGYCPQLSTTSASASLAAGAACEFVVQFVPAGQYSGMLTDTLTLYDNSLAVGTSVQTIALSGFLKTNPTVPLTPSINWTQPASIIYGGPLGPILDATAVSGSTPVTGTFTYTAMPAGGGPAAVTSGSVLSVGIYTLTAIFFPSSSAYRSATKAVSLTVGQAMPTVTLTSSLNPAIVTNNVAFMATVTANFGSPSGTVTFLDGTTPLGAATLSGGKAAFTTPALAAGAHTITAVYAGDTNFAAATTSPVSEVVEDFVLSFPGGGAGAPTQTLAPGKSAFYTLVFDPLVGTTFPDPVNLSVSGLPPGATATISPQTLPAGTPLTDIKLTIQLPQTAKLLEQHAPSLAWGLLLLPFAGGLSCGRRRIGRILPVLLWTAALVAGAGMIGCGSINSGFFAPSQHTYSVVVTATSGSLSHTATVSLMVE